MYSEFIAEPDLQRAIIFHGHFCPGLAIGYRASILALERLADRRSPDDSLLAIVESKTCAADAIQCLTGCTFGHDNFIFDDRGRHGYTFALRPGGQAIRVVLRPQASLMGDVVPHDQWVNWLLAAPAEEVFEIQMRQMADLLPQGRLANNTLGHSAGTETHAAQAASNDLLAQAAAFGRQAEMVGRSCRACYPPPTPPDQRNHSAAEKVKLQQSQI
jgi:hypothetical protein